MPEESLSSRDSLAETHPWQLVSPSGLLNVTQVLNPFTIKLETRQAHISDILNLEIFFICIMRYLISGIPI